VLGIVHHLHARGLLQNVPRLLRLSGFSNSTLMAMLCPLMTGTRTQVFPTRMAESPRILCVSLRILISSVLSPESSLNEPTAGNTLKAIWCG
jgi:hypothetical protein